MESNEILKRYVAWCDTCAATMQIEIHKLPGQPDRKVCRRCQKEVS